MKNVLFPENDEERTKQAKELNDKYGVDILAVSKIFQEEILNEIMKGKHPFSLFVLAGTAFQMGYNARKNEAEKLQS